MIQEITSQPTYIIPSPYIIPGIINLNHPSPELIIHYVCEYFNQDKADVKGLKRTREFVTARHMSMYLIKEMTSETKSNIALKFNRDHTTVIHAMNKINGFIDIKDRDTLRAIEKIKNNLRTNN